MDLHVHLEHQSPADQVRSESRVMDGFVVHTACEFVPLLGKWVPSVKIGRHWNEPNPMALSVSALEYQDTPEDALEKAYALASEWINKST